jgi:Fe-S cluster assembly iron-binding protein IscA
MTEVLMVHVTDRAREQLRAVRDRVAQRPEVCLRLRPNEKGRFGLYPDTEREGDQVVEHDGTPVLVIGRDMAAAMAGGTIDFEEREGKAHWTLRGG